MDLLTEYYVAAYKKKQYQMIAIGDNINGEKFRLSPKQIKALEYLNDNKTAFIGYGGSGRCFVPETLVLTNKGHKQISKVKFGDYVLSYSKGEFKFNRVIRKYRYYGTFDAIKVNGNLICTAKHRFLYKGRWIKASNFKSRFVKFIHESLSIIKNFFTIKYSDYIGTEWILGTNNPKKNIFVREITEKEMLGSSKFKYSGEVYDLEVEDFHSYCVTKDNIIAHNSGKTLLESVWITFQCLAYPGVRYGLCRKELSVLKSTALNTLFNVLAYYNLYDKTDFTYHEQKNKISFKNGSEVILKDLAYQPSDPLYTRFGGLELTGCAIDESNENDIEAIKRIFTRVNWCKNNEYKIAPKMLETFNPSKGHVFDRYYQPYRDDKESDFVRFVPALPTDNPHPSIKSWIESIVKDGNKNNIQRLVYGNFDYDDNDDVLVGYDAIMDMFCNETVKPQGEKYISADIALHGRDRFVAIFWHGGVGHIIVDKLKAGAREVEHDLKSMMQRFGVWNSNVVGDSDGLGAYLEDYIRNIYAFRGNRRAVNAKEFDNLRSECGYKLAELINQRKLRLICTEEQEKLIKQELSICLRRDNMGADDQKKKLVKKPEIKKQLGRSPDYYDSLMMVAVFYLDRNKLGKISVSVE